MDDTPFRPLLVGVLKSCDNVREWAARSTPTGATPAECSNYLAGRMAELADAQDLKSCVPLRDVRVRAPLRLLSSQRLTACMRFETATCMGYFAPFCHVTQSRFYH